MISNKVLEAIDDEIKRFVSEGHQKATAILQGQRTILDDMAQALLVRETLDAKDIAKLMDGEHIITDEEMKTYEAAKASGLGGGEADGPRDDQKLATAAMETAGVPGPLNAMPLGT